MDASNIIPEHTLLEIRNLRVSFPTREGELVAIDGIDLDVGAGEIVALVGESGSGKSTCGLSILGLLDKRVVATGSIRFDDVELLDDGGSTQASLRGREMAMIFQEPTGALNPVRTIGSQLREMICYHTGTTTGAAQEKAAGMLEKVQVPDAAGRMKQYPHEMSGGLNQRIVIGMMLLHGPRLLIADEPTTALDVSTQAEVLTLLTKLRDEQGLAILFVTHDLAIVSMIADRVAVMQRGRIVESGPTSEVLTNPKNPYTKALVEARLDWTTPPPVLVTISEDPILRVASVTKSYARKSGVFGSRQRSQILSDVSFAIKSGEAFGLVGESGSGKSTLARIVAGLELPDSGTVKYGAMVEQTGRKALHRSVQYVFQDPAGALDRRLRIKDQLREPLDIHAIGERRERDSKCVEMLELVELDRSFAGRFPHELSGGQRQRVVLARALMLQPRLLICDEPVSALDASTQRQILKLLHGLRERLGLSLLFVSHDLTQVRYLCDRVAVLKTGEIVETGECRQVLETPQHPYTKMLVSSIPRPHSVRTGLPPATEDGTSLPAAAEV
ncbi:dipeptide ABC transporter ATP-binding protein [Mesorhizobium sp. B4-1-4]|uniref:dipeptide ABC transporter ATP-binding protein n=1 Tax=Mesorhizobium sp. B4-1-4 TaxID=2589888 RepID=UPI0015E3191E|nr:ABC transporter ATP-binding protein [Mesorhizobium sp. B4-1-4]UCI32093.1 ABC transporter ATP-binding protein [Mesorhizobium sp. B4-1-4]